MSIKVGQVYAELSVYASKFAESMRQTDKDLNSFTKKLEQAQAAAAGFLSFRFLKGMASELNQIGQDTENLRIQLEAALGDVTKAAERFKQALDFDRKHSSGLLQDTMQWGAFMEDALSDDSMMKGMEQAINDSKAAVP